MPRYSPCRSSDNSVPVNIRPAKKPDLPAVLEIERQSATAAHWSNEQYEHLFESGVILVAELDGIVRGFICANSVVPEWELENVVVAHGARRRGVADALVSELVNIFKSRSGVSLWLEVRESNHPARRLYEKHGFRETGVRDSYYRDPVEDAVLYEWRRPSSA